MKKKIIVVGAGPGGLTCAMLLTQRGYEVTVFEKEDRVGGRNAAITLGDYTFDTGPTFLMMTFILREMFRDAGKNLDDYCKVVPLDPMYKLSFPDRDISPSSDHNIMQRQIEQFSGAGERGLVNFLKRERVRYDRMFPCLQRPYDSITSLISFTLFKAMPHLSLGKSLYDVLGDYFQDEQLRIAFTFQAKYLGMSPWECPGLFTIIPYVEHKFGIDHVEGGLSRISDAMAEIGKEKGVSIQLSTPVKKILVSGGSARGVMLDNNKEVAADAVVINADFGYAMEQLFDNGVIRKWHPRNLNKKKFSCSTFMLYLGLDKLYDEPHHQILFANDYKANIEDIVNHNPPSADMSIYVRNASITDPTLAPPGHSALYVLVPVSNMRSNTDWNEKITKEYRDKTITLIQRRTSMNDLTEHIREEKIITPSQWQSDYNLFAGSTFNLGHNLTQMLNLRPHNKFEEVDNCYIVGGGTHPGSGLPTIYESARISANLITRNL